MAVDLCTENPSLSTSPRISFSYDLRSRQPNDETENDESILKDFYSQSQSKADLNFCFAGAGGNEPSPADELFSGGLIRPLQLHEKFITSNQISLSKNLSLSSFPLPSPSDQANSKPENPKKEVEMANQESDQPTKRTSKSFWGIKRSSSLHCESSHKKSSSFWSLPLLSRSNSTGSVPNSKQSSKESQKQSSSQKQARNFASSSSSLPSSSSFSMYNFSQKPPLKKNYGNGVRISPVLHVPHPPFISGGSFGLSSLFRSNGKEKKNKK